MEPTTRFDWDRYIETTPYAKVLGGMGGHGSSTPTMYSPDTKLLYLRTRDLAFSTDDLESLNRELSTILKQLEGELILNRWSYKELYLLEVDYLTVWGLLHDRHALPEDYQYPEFYLERAMKLRMQKAGSDLLEDVANSSGV